MNEYPPKALALKLYRNRFLKCLLCSHFFLMFFPFHSSRNSVFWLPENHTSLAPLPSGRTCSAVPSASSPRSRPCSPLLCSSLTCPRPPHPLGRPQYTPQCWRVKITTTLGWLKVTLGFSTSSGIVHIWPLDNLIIFNIFGPQFSPYKRKVCIKSHSAKLL